MVVQLFPPRHVYFPSTPAHTCTVILLHDTNSTGAELATALATSTSTAIPGKSIFEHFPSCRWVFPSAQPRQTDTCHASRGNWFDIDIVANADAEAVSPQQAQPSPSAAKDKDKDEDEDLEACVEYILQIVEEEVGRLAGDSGRVVLGGFGQGMAVAAATLITARRRLGGFVGVSGWVPLPGKTEGLGGRGQSAKEEARMGGSEGLSEVDGVEVDAEAGEVGRSSALHEDSAGSVWETPVLLSYLEDDPCVDIRKGLSTYEALSRLGFVNVVWDPRPGSQQGENWLLDSSQLDTVVGFLAEVFGHEG